MLDIIRWLPHFFLTLNGKILKIVKVRRKAHEEHESDIVIYIYELM